MAAPMDIVGRGREIVGLLESADVPALQARRSERLQGWDVEEWVREAWMPRLLELAGSGRRVVRSWRVSELLARYVLEGSGGVAYVSVRFDESGALDGLAMAEDERQGGVPRGVVVGCPGERCDELRAFYAGLVRARLGFGEGLGVPPRWPDPAYPQQIHLDVLVADLDAAESAALGRGATSLRDFGDHRVLADPLGHPFCLYVDADNAARPEPGEPGVLKRIVVDCPDPRALAPFYEGVLGIPHRVEDSAAFVTIVDEPGSLPGLGFQRVDDYRAPRWPDPAYPAQMHLDLFFDDRREVERRALDLGATRLPPQGGSCPVYADPVGHPFCLCGTGE